MCGRYTLRHQQMVENAFGAALGTLPSDVRRSRFNVAPGQMMLVLRQIEGKGRSAEAFRWGIDAPWKKGGGVVINARAEKLQESRLWRPLVEKRERRILVPADGFYEWRAGKAGEPKQPFLFELADGGPFAFAGLMRPPTEDEPGTFAIVTCAANDLVADVHDRMPVMLTPDTAAAWADGDVDSAMAVAVPLASTAMRARPVSRAVNNARRDDPELLDEAPAGFSESNAEQDSLFGE